MVGPFCGPCTARQNGTPNSSRKKTKTQKNDSNTIPNASFCRKECCWIKKEDNFFCWPWAVGLFCGQRPLRTTAQQYTIKQGILFFFSLCFLSSVYPKQEQQQSKQKQATTTKQQPWDPEIKQNKKNKKPPKDDDTKPTNKNIMKQVFLCCSFFGCGCPNNQNKTTKPQCNKTTNKTTKTKGEKQWKSRVILCFCFSLLGVLMKHNNKSCCQTSKQNNTTYDLHVFPYFDVILVVSKVYPFFSFHVIFLLHVSCFPFFLLSLSLTPYPFFYFFDLERH